MNYKIRIVTGGKQIDHHRITPEAANKILAPYNIDIEYLQLERNQSVSYRITNNTVITITKIG